ncbi:MAG: RNA polymerase sporulation sigma factor SigG [Clostridia bacterium]|nr:RNA polymerase sporulation sigma factor SigG [Clostridia bacterium]
MQYNKGEMCGINASALEVLSEDEKMRLLIMARKGDSVARDRLTTGNLRLVLSVIQRFSNRGENPDDLFQVGCIGLIKAIDNFDLSQNVRFSTYAVPMIIGEVRRYLRDNNPVRVSRSIRDTAYHAMQVKERLTANSQTEPTVDEIAKEMGIKRSEVVIALEAIVDPISLHDPVYFEGGDAVFVMDQISDNSSDTDWLDEICIKQELSQLGEREKQIMALRFLMGKTQTEVAKEVGISQAQVSRLEKCAMDKIKGGNASRMRN